jgi:cellulose biosynthesis protein BcsQ
MAAELYTHFDVLDRLSSPEACQNAPKSLHVAKPLPSRLVLSITANTPTEPVRDWLAELFGPRYDRTNDRLILESLTGSSRSLPVAIVEMEEDVEIGETTLRLRPTLAKRKVVVYNAKYAHPLAADLGECPPVLTFHSFKGGMGRTTLALALSDGLVKRGRKVLFVDADFEAPGISTLLKHVMPSPGVSFADALALAHATPDPEAEEAIALVAERLSDQVIDGLTVLPCTRDLNLPDTLPETLTYSSSRSAFFVGELLAKIGKKLGVDLILVDLRAGLSELVASLFLDPRLQHVLVTTLNGQAIDGTIMLLERMKDIAAKWTDATGERLATSLSVIVNQVPTVLDGHVSSALEVLDDELRKFAEIIPESSRLPEIADSSNPFFDRPVAPILLPSIERINLLPRDLTTVRKLLSESAAQKVMLDNFLDLLPVAPPAPVEAASRVERCRRLEEYTESAIFAESAAQFDIFPTRSLIKLAERHLSSVPTAVVLGDKGAGKTYTFMSLALSKTWEEFVRRLSPAGARQSDARILPVTTPQDLGEQGRELERSITNTVANLISGNAGLSDQMIVDTVDSQKARPGAEGVSAWRNFWLDLIAWRCGLRIGETGAFNDLPALLASKDERIIAIFDGIETIFKQVKNSEVERVAVEALLRNVPDWLAQLPSRRVGAIVFIREDVARLSLVNNFKQFEDRYGAYALKWNWAEALALAFWIAQKSGAISSDRSPTSLVEVDEEERGKVLEPLWGWKLGPTESREARSQEWVMSSLSDFNRRIKARDLVRFLNEAAKRSRPGDNFYDERLLSPRSMRDAIDPCSTSRVFETGEENDELQKIFTQITNLSHYEQELPWRLDQAVQRISAEAIRALEENGVFFRDGDEYYVPEVYRNGLKLYYTGGARRRVVTLMRRAPNQTT